MFSAGSIPSTAARELLAPLLLSIAVAAVTPTLTTDWTDDDVAAELDFCDVLEIADPSVPLQVWANESDNRSGAHNPNGDASGVFQLMPATARGLGYPLAGDPHLDAYRAMGVSGQLRWATRYYGPHKGQIGTVARLYLCTFLPALLECGDNMDAVLAVRDGTLGWAYAANHTSFDPHGTGVITVQSLVDAAQRATGPRTRELIARAVEAKRARVTQPGA